MRNNYPRGHNACKLVEPMRNGQSGMTLIELMIVVVIIGVLVSVAVPMLTKTTNKARASEVPAMFAEFQLRQGQYYAENGSYLSTGVDESETYPAAPGGKNPVALGTVPATWTALRMQPDKNAVYCAYVAIGGNAGAAPGAEAQAFGMAAAPPTDWYYLLAECDFDNDPAVNSLYFTSNDLDAIASRNQGR